jgi:hypothetical protein
MRQGGVLVGVDSSRQIPSLVYAKRPSTGGPRAVAPALGEVKRDQRA